MPGFLLVSVLFNSRFSSVLFRLALAYGIGSYFITIQLFILIFVFKQDLSLFWFSLVMTVELLIVFDYYKRGRVGVKRVSFFKQVKLTLDRIRLKEAVLLLLIIAQIGLATFNAFSRPVATYDSTTMWSYKAKVLYSESPQSFFDINNINYLGGNSHVNYPWNIPLMQFWLSELLGEFNDVAINYIFVGFYISILILLYGFLRFYLSIFKSLTLVFLLSSMPLFFYHSYNAYADLPLSYLILASFGCLYLWLDSKERGCFNISAFYLSIAIFTKSEGVLFIVALALLLLYLVRLKRLQRKQWYFYLGLVILCISPWEYFRLSHGLGITNEGGELGFHPEVFYSLYSTFFLTNSFSIWWYVVLVVFLISIKKIFTHKMLLFGWAYLFLLIFFYSIIYVSTDSYMAAITYTAVGRNILTITPLSVFIVGVTLGAFKRN